MSEKHWKTFVKSRFPWEQDALDFIHAGFPAQDTYTAWANFEFVADDGSINEVDLLVACPQGVFLIEIKGRPGTVSGDAQNWLWEHDGKRRSDESPLLLANRKCKRLKSLLLRQRAFRKVGDCFLLNRWCSCHIRMFEFNSGIWRQTRYVGGINRIAREFLGPFVGGNALDFEPSRCRWSTGPCFEPLLRQWIKPGFVGSISFTNSAYSTRYVWVVAN